MTPEGVAKPWQTPARLRLGLLQIRAFAVVAFAALEELVSEWAFN